MRLPRPYIPLPVRIVVAERQWSEELLGKPRPLTIKKSAYLRFLLLSIFDAAEVELHHRPALCNRRRYVRKGKVLYDPPANDPDHLIYLRAGRGEDHDIETRVRGVGAQLSDLGQLRKAKRKARKASRPKRKWPSRPFNRRRPTLWSSR